MSNETRGGELQIGEAHRVKLDLTINVPTIVTLCLLVVSSSVAGVRIYNDLDQRVTRAGYFSDALAHRVQVLETTVGQIRTDQANQIKELRAEIRADLSEIKGSLNNLLLRPNKP